MWTGWCSTGGCFQFHLGLLQWEHENSDYSRTLARSNVHGVRNVCAPHRCSQPFHFALCQGCHSSLESADGLLTMLAGIGDGLAEVMSHALGFISLGMEQGLTMYTAVLKVHTSVWCLVFRRSNILSLLLGCGCAGRKHVKFYSF